MKQLCNILCIALISFPASSEIYKWVDDQGRIHYGDKPSNKAAVELDVNTKKNGNIKSSGSREEKRKKLLDAIDEDKARKKEEKEKRVKKKKKQERKCVLAKDRLRQYEKSSYIYTLDKEGNRIISSDEDRNRKTEKLRERINKYCK